MKHRRRPASALTLENIQRCVSHPYKQRPRSSHELFSFRSCDKLGYDDRESMCSNTSQQQVLLYLSDEEDDNVTDGVGTEYRLPKISDKSSLCSSIVPSSAVNSDEDVCWEMYNPDEFELKSKSDGYDSEGSECHFGQVAMKQALKRLHFDISENTCACCDLIGWNSPCLGKCLTRKNQKQKKQQTTFFQSSNLNNRIYGGQDKDAMKYSFQHYDDSSNYIKEYRKYFTYRNKIKTDVTENDMYDKFLSEVVPCSSKVRENTCAVAENYNFYAFFTIDKDASDSFCDVDELEDSIKSISMNERGKNLNLAPVRSPKSHKEIKHGKKPYVALNQYLNLVIPKTTLHKKNLQLNLDPPRELSTKFETKRNPLKTNDRSGGSAENHKYKSNSQPSSGGNRASELRIARANTCVHGINVTRETGIIIPQQKQCSPRLNTYKMRGQKHTPRSRASTTDDPKESIDHFPNVFEGSMKIDLQKHGDLFPAKNVGMLGSVCRGEDQLSIIHRVRKEKERTMRVSVVK